MGLCSACQLGWDKLCRLGKGLSVVQQAQLRQSTGQESGLPGRGHGDASPLGRPPQSPLSAPVNGASRLHPVHRVAVVMQPPSGRSNPTGTYKILRLQFPGEGNFRRPQGGDIPKMTKDVLFPYEVKAHCGAAVQAEQCRSQGHGVAN